MAMFNFDMNLLVVLGTLLDERSVTRTGDRLGRTQSAISNSLKKLRVAFNDPLLVRGQNGLVLTPRAVVLQRQVEEILALTEDSLSNPMQFDPATATDHFRLSAPDRLILPVMLPLLNTIRAEAPGTTIEIINTGRDEALIRLDDDRSDISIGWFEGRPPRCNASFLFTDYMTCVSRTDHPIMKQKEPLSLESVLSYPNLVISSVNDPREAFDTMLVRRGLRRNIAISLSNYDAVSPILKESDLVGVFAQRIAGFLARENGLTARRLPPEIAAFDHYMVWHKRYEEDPRHRWLQEKIATIADVS